MRIGFYLHTNLLADIFILTTGSKIIILLWKVSVFSIGNELYESILILAKLWLILYVMRPFSLIR